MPLSKTKAIERNEEAVKALEKSVARLKELRKGKPMSVRDVINRDIARANEEIVELKIVTAHLRAAETEIKPISAADQKRLNELADALDEKIKADFALNATLETVLDVITFAKEIGSIIDAHS